MVGDADTCATSTFAVFASENLPMRAKFRALRSLPGKTMDRIANMIISLKNAGNAGRETVVIPYSKLKHSILDALKKEGFIKNFEARTDKKKPELVVELYIENRIPKIKGVQRISKSSKRVYKKAGELRPVKNGYGAMIVSTPKGVMSAHDARKAKLGGEALFSIW